MTVHLRIRWEAVSLRVEVRSFAREVEGGVPSNTTLVTHSALQKRCLSPLKPWLINSSADVISASSDPSDTDFDSSYRFTLNLCNVPS